MNKRNSPPIHYTILNFNRITLKNTCRITFLYLLLACFCWTCTNTNNRIYDNIVLKTPDIKITEYEFEKNLTVFKESFQIQNNVQPEKKDIEQWIDDFINSVYFLQDAYVKGYFNSEIDQRTEGMAYTVVSQPDGLLVQELLKKIHIKNKEIRLAKKRCSRKIHVEYLKFLNPDYDSVLNFIGANQLTDSNSFRETAKKCLGHKDIIHDEIVLTWPFQKLWEYQEYLYNLKKGDVTPVLSFYNGYHVICIKDILISLPELPSGELKKKLANELKKQKEEKIKLDFQKDILQDTKISYNSITIESMKNVLSHNQGFEIDKRRFKDFLSLNVMTFNAGNKKIEVTMEDFIDFNNHLPIRDEIKTPAHLVYCLQSMALKKHIYKKACDMGITSKKRFLSDKENYREKLVSYTYEMDEFMKGTKATNEEIIERYNRQDKKRFIQASNATVSIFVFENYDEAMAAKYNIDAKGIDSIKNSDLHGIRDFYLHKKLEYESCNYPQPVKTAMFNLAINQVSDPIPFEDMYFVAIKESEYGSRVKRVNEVWGTMMKEIAEEKYLTNKAQRLTELKEKYSLDNMIDYQKYAP